MKTQVNFLSVVLAAAVCTNLTACGVSEGANSSKGSNSTVPNEIDAYGTLTRGGEQIDVYVCHDQKAVYLYYNDEEHELFDKAMLPTDELYDTDWALGVADFDDVTGDNNSDLQVYLSHSDMTESHIVWEWEEGAVYVYQPDYSRLNYPIVIYDPPEDAVYYDYSMYEGLWLSDVDNLYPDQYLQFDANGNWTLFSGGEEIDNGYLWYDETEKATYVCSILGGAIDGGSIEVDGDRLNITGCGNFNYIDGRGGKWQGDGGSNRDGENRENIDGTTTDFSMYEGLWLSDEDSLYPDTYIQFDAEGNWTLTKDGETTDEGNLKYNADEGEVIVYSSRGGAIDGGIAGMEEEDRFYISTFGYFNYLDGRGGKWQGDGGSNWDGENRENIDGTTTDFSMYEGLWQSDDVNLFPGAYLQIDAQGSWTLTSDGEEIDNGYLKYEADEGEIYVYSSRGGFVDQSLIRIEGSKLNISVCGYFNYLDGRGGQWQGDGGSNWDGEER